MLEELKKQEFYKEYTNKLNDNLEKLSSIGYSNYDTDSINQLIIKMEDGTFTDNDLVACDLILNSLNINMVRNSKSTDWINNLDDKTEEDINYIDSLLDENRKFYSQYNNLNEVYIETKSYIEDINNSQSELDEYFKEQDKTGDNFLYENAYGNTIIGNTFGSTTFDELINSSENSDLQSWYKFLKDLHEKPIKSFILNKNTICNFKLIFRNPYTGLTTDKETIVHLSHSTSAKKAPTFGIGSVSYQAVSTGVKLLAGSLVTAAYENVPLPYLHAISYMNHSSVEDLPPLDLYIIPIENINDDGRYEVLMIKGIQFVDMKQNDNASSTGIYYAFSFFAKDIVPLDFSETRQYFKIQYEGNNNL